MKALTWHGKSDIRCESVPDPKIQHPRDAIIKVTACAICGSDLHIYDGMMPGMKSGDVLGHETMGEVVEVGSENKKLKVGDRVVVPFVIACGNCFFCQKQLYSACDNSNPAETADMSETLYGYPQRPFLRRAPPRPPTEPHPCRKSKGPMRSMPITWIR